MADLTNAQIAEALDELGDLYELDGQSKHRVLAYRNAAKSIREASGSVCELIRAGKVQTLKGVGATLAEKLEALVADGEIPATRALKETYPEGLLEMTKIPGLGPRRARQLFDELQLDSVGALKQAAEAGQIAGLKGFGAKFEQNMLDAIERQAKFGEAGRVRLDIALKTANVLLEAIRAQPSCEAVELGGSARRMTETVKDLDIVAASADPAALIDAVVSLDLVAGEISGGAKKAHFETQDGIGVDLRVVDPENFGNLIQHFTGSKDHNAALRTKAVQDGYHVSEYGVEQESNGAVHRFRSEREVYEFLGYEYIPPELREDRGELEAARTGGPGLPELVTLDQIRGDLHMHTTASDGRGSIEDMAEAAIQAGYEYVAITDHSASHGFGNAVGPDDLLNQVERVREADSKIDGIKILIGSEVNILPDGAPDYEDAVLAELDWVIASVHSSFAMDEAAMTDRIVRAIEHPLVDAIGHPTGRLITKRPPYAVDFDRVFDAAARTSTLLEINANPQRRDLSEINARAAAAEGVRIVICSDAHHPGGFDVMPYGIATARRGWLTAKDVANTEPWDKLAPTLSRAVNS